MPRKRAALLRGKRTIFAAGDGNVVVVSEHLAQLAGLAVGDKFTIPSTSGTTEFVIVGIITTTRCPASKPSMCRCRCAAAAQSAGSNQYDRSRASRRSRSGQR